MGHRLPESSRKALLPGALRADRRAPPIGLAWCMGTAAMLVACVPAADSEFGATGPATLGAVAPLVALAAWAYAGSRAIGRVRAAFWVVAAAAAVGAAAQLYATGAPVLVADPTGSVSGPGAWYALLGMSALIAAGAALMLAPGRAGPARASLFMDTVILLLVGVVVALRLVVEPLIRVDADTTELAVGTAQQVFILAPVLLASLVVLRRGSALTPRSAVLFLLGTLVLATWSMVYQTPVVARPSSSGGVAVGLWSIGWGLFAFAGFAARSLASTPRAMLERRRTRDRLRNLLVPSAALVLAASILDIGTGSPPRLITVVALSLLAGTLALRTAHALRLTEREADQARQLAHTQALVAVTHSLAGTTDLDATLRVISEAARSVFGTRGAGIELVTDDGRSLETRSAVGMPEDIMGMRFPVEGSFTGWVVRHGEPRASLDPSRDPYIQPQSLNYLGRWPVAAAPIRFRGETLGALFACIRPDPFEAEELQLLGAMAEQAAIAIQNARLFEQVTFLSITDPLTGLANRRQLERELARDFAAAQRGGDLVAVIFDLDDFKDYNDSHGHLAGDEALQVFANALRDETRAMNLAARYGGDEFVALLAGTDVPGARLFVERVRRRFDVEVAALGRGEIGISAGIGAFTPEMRAPDELLREADAALYRAKPRSRT
jgi:diguanylate cyclase (GGDEF)-like protein